MPSKGLSAIPCGIARMLGSTVRTLEKEFRYVAPSARRPAAPSPAPAVKPAAAKSCFFKSLLDMPCPKTVQSQASVAIVEIKTPDVIMPSVTPVVPSLEPVVPVTSVLRVEPVAPVAPVVSVRPVAAAVTTTSKDDLLRGIQFESKSEQVRAEIYFRDLRSSNKAQRMEAITEIKKLSRPIMIAGLRQTLSGEQDPMQIIEILNALASIGVEAQVPKQFFLGYLSNHDTGVRLAALRAVSKFSDEESFGLLSSLVKDKAPEIRRQALNCLCWTFSDRALPFAVKALHDADPDMRKAASQICGTLKSSMAVSALISLLSDPSEEVQESASQSLKKITKQDFAFKVSAPKKAKDDAIEGWRYWWRDHQTNFERVKK